MQAHSKQKVQKDTMVNVPDVLSVAYTAIVSPTPAARALPVVELASPYVSTYWAPDAYTNNWRYTNDA